MINKQNQGVRTSGVLLTSILLAACAFVIKSPWNRSDQQIEAEKALQKAQVVGYQIIHLYREASNKTPGVQRGIASEAPEEIRAIGTIGTDPWGKPYRYRLLRESENKLKVLVWSSGPNQKVESTQFETEESLTMEQPQYQGDDLGIVISL